MCLTISNRHCKFLGKYLPIKVKEDILVKKLLCVPMINKNGPKWETPYQHMQINFRNGKCVLPKISLLRFFIDKHPLFKGLQYIGYHSYLDNIRLNYMAYDRMFNAVIPKGSYVYYGECGELCSTQLIIKENAN